MQNESHRILAILGILCLVVVLLGATMSLPSSGGASIPPALPANSIQYYLNSTAFGGSPTCIISPTTGFPECTCNPNTSMCDDVNALEVDAVSEPATAGTCAWNVYSSAGGQSKLCWFCAGEERYCLTGTATSDAVSGDLAQWELDETSGTTASDTGSKTCEAGACNGTLTNFAATPPWTATGLTFDGVDDHIVISGSDDAGHDLNFVAGDPFSVVVRFVSSATPDGDGTLVAMRDGDVDIQWQMYLQSSNRLYFNTDVGRGYISIPTIAASTTYNFGFTVDESGFPRLYENCTEGTWVDESGSRPFNISAKSVNLAIGVRFNVEPTTAFQLAGEFRFVYIFDRVLSPEDMTAVCSLPD